MNPKAAPANLSHLRQTRWVTIPTPCAEADTLPQHCVIDGRYIATKAHRLGDHTQFWHARMDLHANASGPLVDWQPWPAGIPFPRYRTSAWITDDMEAVKLYVDIEEEGRDAIAVPLVYEKSWDESAACVVWLLHGNVDGWDFTVYAHTYTEQDVVDLELIGKWATSRRPNYQTAPVRITLRSGGEPIHSWAGNLRGQRQIDQKSVVLYDGPTAHGYPILWLGIMGAVPKEIDKNGADDARLSNVWAAHAGPIVADAKFGEHWMGFGMPEVEVPAGSLQAEWLAYSKEQHGYHDQRRLASDVTPGRAGNQEPFGAVSDIVCDGRPWRIPMLLHAAMDPRAWMHADNDGSQVTHATNPGLQTWEGLIHLSHSPDTLGKSRQQMGDPFRLGVRHIGMDDQHDGTGPLVAAWARTGLYCLRDLVMAKIATDEMRAFPARWQSNQPLNWLDAPRATGRLLQLWSRVLLLATGATRDRLVAMIVRELDMWTAALPTVGQVRFAYTTTDPRVLAGPGLKAMPWQDGLLCLGLLEARGSLERVGLTATAHRCEQMAILIGRNVVQWGFVKSAWGRWLAVTGLKINEDGSANPPSYYTYPREGAATGAFQGVDMMVDEGSGMANWCSGAVMAALRGPDDAVRERAREIRSQYEPAVTDVDGRKWWGCR